MFILLYQDKYPGLQVNTYTNVPGKVFRTTGKYLYFLNRTNIQDYTVNPKKNLGLRIP